MRDGLGRQATLNESGRTTRQRALRAATAGPAGFALVVPAGVATDLQALHWIIMKYLLFTNSRLCNIVKAGGRSGVTSACWPAVAMRYADEKNLRTPNTDD